MKLIKRSPIILLLIFFLCTIFLAPMVGGEVSAADETPDSIDETNVLDDLEGSTLNGKEFNKDDFEQSDIRDPQIISLVEYGYSFYSSRQQDYGLYVYIYNPHGVAFDTDTGRNRIQMKVGDGGEATYQLNFLNYSNQLGYEGLFYKFKIRLTETQQRDVLSALGRAERVYRVTEFELSEKNVVRNHKAATVYTFTGFAKGYGSELAADENTLTCAVDGFEEYVELDVHQTVYRPKGDLSIQSEEKNGIYSQGQLKDGNQPQLNSCYFRVPKKYFTQYGELTRTVCEWDEYMTQPILLTTNLQAYRNLQAIQGSPTTAYYPEKDYGVMIISFGNQYYTNEHLFNPDWHVTPFLWTSNLETKDFDPENYSVSYWYEFYELHWPGGGYEYGRLDAGTLR